MKTIGVLALQGGFSKHIDILDTLSIASKEIRLPEELESIDGLILPGGESTTNIKLIHSYQLYEPILKFASQKPIFGTCAGSILMGKKATNFDYTTFNLIDVCVIRNAYGTQVNSFVDSFSFEGQTVDAMFIRAPKFSDIGEGVDILAYHNNEPVIVRNKHHLMMTCHPELTNEYRIHDYFVTHFVSSRV